MDHAGKMIDIKIDPSPRDIRIFAILWLVFFIILGKLAFFTDRAILSMAIFTSLMFIISFAFNKDYPRRSQLWGLLIPGFLWSVFLGERLAHARGGWWEQISSWAPYASAPRFLTFTGNHAQWAVFTIVLAIAVIGGILIFVSRASGRAIYRGWMFAALPIGWTFSHVILGIVYFGVLTPIGLLLRAMGKDPMNRRPDPSAQTYWIPHRQERDLKRYFRQF
jgi:hypothetical protein